MTDIAEAQDAPTTESGERRRRKGTGLDAMVLPELKQLAQSLGVKSGGMRKGQLIDAIRAAQSGGSNGGSSGASNGGSSSGQGANGDRRTRNTNGARESQPTLDSGAAEQRRESDQPRESVQNREAVQGRESVQGREPEQRQQERPQEQIGRAHV